MIFHKISSIESLAFKVGIMAVVGVLNCAPAAYAQTIVVDANLTTPDNIATFNNLQNALASFATPASTGGAGANNGNALPNIINVTAGAPVTGTACVDANAVSGKPELLIMDDDITIQGVGGQAVYVGSNFLGSELSAAFFWRQDVDLTINNMGIIPSATDTGLRLAYFKATTTSNSSAVVNLNNCLITSNDGTGVPVTLDGQDNPDLSTGGVISVPDDGDALYFVSRVESQFYTLNMTNTVIASYSKGGTSDGIIMFMSGNTSDKINCFVNLNEGCVIANAARLAVQNPSGGSLVINGTEANPVVIRNIISDGIFNNSDTNMPTQPTATSVNHAHFFNIGGAALKEQETSGRGFISSVTNTVIANSFSPFGSAPGIALFSSGALPPGGEATSNVIVDNVTIHNTGVADSPPAYSNFAAQIAAPIYTDLSEFNYSSNRDVTITNSTFSAVESGLMGLCNSGTGLFNLSTSLLSLTGDNGLDDDFVGLITIGSGNSYGPITYANTTDPFAANFFEPQTSVINDWSVY